MKILGHISLLCAIILSVTLFTTGCKPEPTLSVSADSLTFGVSASEQSIEITSNTDWKIIGADGWCSATPAAGSGNAIVRILTGDNTTPADREKSITITAGSISESVKITQRQRDALILSQKSYNLPAEFYVITVNLQSNVSYDVIIPSGISWITAMETKGVTPSALQFAISANDSHDGRSSVIVFKDKGSSLADTLTVNQAQKGALILTKKSYTLPPAASFIDVELRTNTNYEVSYPESVQWINLVNTKALTSYSFRFSVSENNLYESRTARVVFRDKASSLSDTVTITQSQREGVIFGSQRSFMVQRGGGTLNYAVEFNIPYTVTFQADASWITELQTKALTSAGHTFLVQANNSGAERSGKIFLASVNGLFKDTITIRQSAL
ncbi:hypothetical protein MASR2M69_14050 [Bacteroidota bacterium]